MWHSHDRLYLGAILGVHFPSIGWSRRWIATCVSASSTFPVRWLSVRLSASATTPHIWHIGNFRPSNLQLDSHCRYPMSPELVFETYHLIPELCASNTSFSKRLMALSYTLNFSPLSWTISPIPFKFDNWQVIRTAFELEGKKSLTIYSFELNCLRQKSLNTSYSLELNCLIRQKSLSTCPIFYSLELNC